MTNKIGHRSPEATAAVYAPEPEWLPRFRTHMAQEIDGALQNAKAVPHGSLPTKVREVAIDAAVGVAASYLHPKDTEIRDLRE